MPDWQAITAALREQGVGAPLGRSSPRPVGGGDISAAWRLETVNDTLFIKTGPASAIDMFEAEADGLNELASADAVRVPNVRARGEAGPYAFIALEWMDFGPSGVQAERRLGKQLSAMHRHTAKQYGWHRDNTIGLTRQRNPWAEDWVGFFREHRLMFQLELAARNSHKGELQTLGRRLADQLPTLFEDYDPEPSLLHGDLWGGNWAAADGEPVIFDPAVYYGDRESDIAMTRLFGGFGPAFYEAYASAWPLAEGYERRQTLYQLYHILNHLNLFGGSYADSAVRSMRSLCSH